MFLLFKIWTNVCICMALVGRLVRPYESKDSLKHHMKKVFYGSSRVFTNINIDFLVLISF